MFHHQKCVEKIRRPSENLREAANVLDGADAQEFDDLGVDEGYVLRRAPGLKRRSILEMKKLRGSARETEPNAAVKNLVDRRWNA